MNDRLFCQHIALVVERKRQEAQAQAQAEVGRGEEAAGISEKREEGQETAVGLDACLTIWFSPCLSATSRGVPPR